MLPHRPSPVFVGRVDPRIFAEVDVHGHDTGITKQGSKLLRWSLIEGIPIDDGGPQLADFCCIAERRGKNRARVAIARKVLTLAYYGLRGREIRCLTRQRRHHEASFGHDPGGGGASPTIGMTPTPRAAAGSAN